MEKIGFFLPISMGIILSLHPPISHFLNVAIEDWAAPYISECTT